MPIVDENLERKNVVISRNSYKHAQNYKIKHYLLTEDKYKGNEDFQRQIREKDGQFDVDDSFRADEFLFDTSTPTSLLPKTNTIELQWNNDLIKKSSLGKDPLRDGLGLRDHYSYSKVAFFNISQGYRLDSNEDDFEDHLTRLFVNFGGSIGRVNVSVAENYFFSTQNHRFSFDLSSGTEIFNLGASFRYDSFVNPLNKSISFNMSYLLNDMFYLKTEQEYDLSDERFDARKFGVRYIPLNKCWTLDVAHSISRIKKDYSINFSILFGKNKPNGPSSI
jgi:LPS-assembly protein